ncbi:hypothetical protein KAU32_07665 [bacterium]|nr:hypothetical protein [bacterium]
MQREIREIDNGQLTVDNYKAEHKEIFTSTLNFLTFELSSPVETPPVAIIWENRKKLYNTFRKGPYAGKQHEGEI